MLPGNHLSQLDHVGIIEQPGIQLRIQLCTLWKLQHFDGVLDRGTSAADQWLLEAPANRHDIQIEFRRPPSVKPQLLITEILAPLE